LTRGRQEMLSLAGRGGVVRTVPRIMIAIIGMCCLVGALGVGPASASSLSTVHSTSFAGYQASLVTPVTTISGTLTVPALTCPATGQVNLSAQVSAFSPSGQDAGFDWYAYCSNGVAYYNGASVYTNNGGSTLVGANVGIAPGQTIKAAINQNTVTGKTTVTIKNLTTLANASGSTPNLLSFVGVSAGLFDQNTSGVGMTIPSFSKVTFGKLLFNGAPFSTLSSTRSDLYNGSTLQVATTPISSTGTFSTVFKHV